MKLFFRIEFETAEGPFLFLPPPFIAQPNRNHPFEPELESTMGLTAVLTGPLARSFCRTAHLFTRSLTYSLARSLIPLLVEKLMI